MVAMQGFLPSKRQGIINNYYACISFLERVGERISLREL